MTTPRDESVHANYGSRFGAGLSSRATFRDFPKSRLRNARVAARQDGRRTTRVAGREARWKKEEKTEGGKGGGGAPFAIQL